VTTALEGEIVSPKKGSLHIYI